MLLRLSRRRAQASTHKASTRTSLSRPTRMPTLQRSSSAVGRQLRAKVRLFISIRHRRVLVAHKRNTITPCLARALAVELHRLSEEVGQTSLRILVNKWRRPSRLRVSRCMQLSSSRHNNNSRSSSNLHRRNSNSNLKECRFLLVVRWITWRSCL